MRDLDGGFFRLGCTNADLDFNKAIRGIEFEEWCIDNGVKVLFNLVTEEFEFFKGDDRFVFEKLTYYRYFDEISGFLKEIFGGTSSE